MQPISPGCHTVSTLSHQALGTTRGHDFASGLIDNGRDKLIEPPEWAFRSTARVRPLFDETRWARRWKLHACAVNPRDGARSIDQ